MGYCSSKNLNAKHTQDDIYGYDDRSLHLTNLIIKDGLTDCLAVIGLS